MRVFTLLASSAVALVAACGDGTGVSADQVAGKWEFSRTLNPACLFYTQSLGVYYVTIPASTSTGSGVLQVAGTWGVLAPPREQPWTVTGTVDLESGSFALDFWMAPQMRGEEAKGTFHSSGEFRGTTQDPKPGISRGNWAGFNLEGCTMPITGKRVGG